jgi:hypothetical protein
VVLARRSDVRFQELRLQFFFPPGWAGFEKMM